MRSLLVVALAACSGERAVEKPTQQATGTRLVVVIVVDQLPQWSFVAKAPHLAGGFARILREGEWLTGEHPSGATLTSPGHAVIGTGRSPAQSGILANEWWDREAGRLVKSIEDPAGGVSAARLRVPGLAAMTPGKAFAISLKERAAILPLGTGGTPIWYDPKLVAFTSPQALPWLARTIPLGYTWTPLDADRLARLSGRRDDEPGEVGEKGLGVTFPHALASTKAPADALYATPLGNELVFDVAEDALAHAQLGTDAIPDVLVLSFSSHDYAGHGWGHESWEVWDMVLRFDARLGRFLETLDRHVGRGRYGLIVTSDHGASPLPELVGGGRITFESLFDAANRAAIAELGPGTWIASAKFPFIWLTPEALAQPDRERGIAIKKIMLALRSFPGIEQVGKTADFAGHCDQRTGDAAAICEMIDPERAGEIFYLPKRGWLFARAGEAVATAHNSAHDYDREVPLLLVAPDARPHPPLAKPTAKRPMTEVAGLVRSWLQLR